MKIPAAKPYIPDEEINDILSDMRKILENGMLTQGEYLKRFENMFAQYIGVKNAIGVNSGTCSLEIPLRYYDVKDKEVIVPTNTFIASPNTVIFAGGKPVFADINQETLCIDINDVLEKITPKTKGVMVVHIAGLICPEIQELQEICDDHNLFLIEDAAHAHGASCYGKKAGNLSDAGSFSFFATKPITTGEGGMITTNDDELANIAKSMRHHGVGEGKNIIVRLGYNWRMDEFNAVLGIYQMKNLDKFINMRNQTAEKITNSLQNVDGISLFKVPPNFVHSYYKYPILLDKGIDRLELVKALKENHDIGVGSMYYPPCHLQPLYKELFNYKEGMLPVAEDILNRTVALPIYTQINDEEIDHLINGLKEEIGKFDI